MFNNETIKKIKVTAKIKVLFISDSWDILDIYENETYEAVTDSFYVEVVFLFFMFLYQSIFQLSYSDRI